MSNETQLRGTCPAPFFDLSQFPQNSGCEYFTARPDLRVLTVVSDAKGRICAELPGKDMSCCLPCPAADWIYPENFYMMTRIPGFIALGSIGFCAFLLLAFIVLPVETTKRHYLNTCLLISIILLEVCKPSSSLMSPRHILMTLAWLCNTGPGQASAMRKRHHASRHERQLDLCLVWSLHCRWGMCREYVE